MEYALKERAKEAKAKLRRLGHKLAYCDGMAHDFDELENQAVKFARKLMERGECSDCVCRALAFAAMGLAFDTDNVASIRATMVALLRASERAEQGAKRFEVIMKSGCRSCGRRLSSRDKPTARHPHATIKGTAR